MPETPASIITLNFDEKGLAETSKGAKELEGIFGRIGGTFEKLAKTIAGLAGVAGIGAIVNQFMRIESAATKTALAVNNIRGQGAFIHALTGAQAATGIDAVDLAGGVRGSQMWAGGSFLNSPLNSGNYATFLGHMAQATGMDATSLGALLGQGASVQGQPFSQAGAQTLLAQTYTAAARAGQGGMTGQFLQSLIPLIQQTGFFGGGQNIGSMTAFMGAAMKGDPRFANPQMAASATGQVESVIQGSLTNPRLMAALQMSGANLHQILTGDPTAAMRLARFARTQGKTASELFFYNSFGQQGGALMEDLASGRIKPDQFRKQFQKTMDPQQALQSLMERARAQEDTAVAELKKLEGSVIRDVAPTLKRIENILRGIAGIPDIAPIGLGIYGGVKLGKGINRILNKRAATKAADAAEQAGEAGAKGLAERGAGVGAGTLVRGLRGASKILGGPGLFVQEMLFPDKWLQNMTGGDLSDESWVPGEFKGVRRKIQGMTVGRAEKYIEGQLKHYGSEHTSDEQVYTMVTILSAMLAELRKQTQSGKDGKNKDASFLPGNAQGGVGSGNIMAAFIAGQSGGALMASSVYPLGVGALSGAPAGSPAAGSPVAGSPSGRGWHDCLLTMYVPSKGGINGRDGGGAWSGHPVHDTTWGCAAPPAFPFGTQIQFVYNGKTVIVPVVDRGGAIQGNHFDLLPGPAAALKLPGKANGKYKVLGKGQTGASRETNKGAGTAGGVNARGEHVTGHTRTPANPQAGTADYGGAALGGGFPPSSGGGMTTINVNLDNRRIEQARLRARSM